MNRNKLIISLTILASLLMIALPTILKIYERHEERLLLVSEKKIIESAENCFRTSSCQNHQTTIKELKEKGFLEENIVNPKTKTYYDDNTTLIEEHFSVSFLK